MILPGPGGEQRSYLTNLVRSAWSPNTVREIYRLRWQVELVFKELKQNLNLESVPTSDRHATQVFIWASLLALVVSRTIAAAVFPSTDRLGLAAKVRPSLVSRALRATIRLLAHAWNAPRSLRNGLLRLFLCEVAREHTAIDERREDSFGRVQALVSLGA